MKDALYAAYRLARLLLAVYGLCALIESWRSL